METVQKNFVQVVRGTELAISSFSSHKSNNVTSILLDYSKNNTATAGNAEVGAALSDAAPILAQVLAQIGLSPVFEGKAPNPASLVTK